MTDVTGTLNQDGIDIEAHTTQIITNAAAKANATFPKNRINIFLNIITKIRSFHIHHTSSFTIWITLTKIGHCEQQYHANTNAQHRQL